MQELQYSFHFWASVCEKGTHELNSWYHMRVPETLSFSCFIYSCSHVSSIHPPIETPVSLVTFSVWSQTLALYARSRVRNKCPCFANLFRPSMWIRASKSLLLCSSGSVASGQDGRLRNDKIMMNYTSLHPLNSPPSSRRFSLAADLKRSPNPFFSQSVALLLFWSLTDEHVLSFYQVILFLGGSCFC